MKIGLFEHGGVTRTILSIEIGRAAMRDTKATCAEEVLSLVAGWLKFNNVPWTLADVAASLTLKDRNRIRIDDADVVARVGCPTCNRKPGEGCMTINAQSSHGCQFLTPTHQRRLKAFLDRAEKSDGVAAQSAENLQSPVAP